MVKVIHISEIVNTEDLFEMRQFMLGNSQGEWFVTDDDMFLGRYIDKYRAEEHAAGISGPTSLDGLSTEELLAEAEDLLQKMEDGDYDYTPED